LPAASLPLINTDFSSYFHIRKTRKTCAAPAWILNFTNQLHRFLLNRLWTACKLLIPHELFARKTV